MMYATAGNLDTFLLARSHSTQISRPDLSTGSIGDGQSLGQLPKAERIKAFKKRRLSGFGIGKQREETRAVMYLGLDEVVQLFGDVVKGLAFLVSAVLVGLLMGIARKFDLAPRLEVLECPAPLGRGEANVRGQDRWS